MNIQYKNLPKIYSLIAGIILVISAVTKSLDLDNFSILISQYGFGNIGFVAPLIILAEIFIGLLLIFKIKEKMAALSGIIMIFIFTIIYLYGLAFKEIKDCGCFGRLSLLNTSPFFTIIRNIILIYMLLIVWIKEKNSQHSNVVSKIVLLVVMCLISFICGYSYSHAKIPNTYKAKK